VFEPFYENYWPDSQLSGATVKHVRLQPPNWSFDPHDLKAAFNSRTRAVIVNSPNNPTGKVFSMAELKVLGGLSEEYDALIVCDEIYEHIIFDGEKHVPPITLDGLRHRTVLINSLSKTYSVTGWRVGWVIAPPELTNSIRKVHDFLTVGAATPLQYAGVAALNLPDSYFSRLSTTYQEKRDYLIAILEKNGFRCHVPKGAYYVMCDISELDFVDDLTLCKYLVESIGVAAVPGSSFFADPAQGARLVRFCFAKKFETLDAAAERLAKLGKGP
jgi:aminotransferase